MSAILNYLNAHNFPIFQPILMKLVSKPMIYRDLCYKTYLGWRSPLICCPLFSVILGCGTRYWLSAVLTRMFQCVQM